MSEKLKEAQQWLRDNIDSMPNWEGARAMSVFDSYDIAQLRELAIDRSCATCKWAEKLQRPAPLPDDGGMWCHKVNVEGNSARALSVAWDSAAFPPRAAAYTGDGRLMVFPEHGCTEWEGK